MPVYVINQTPATPYKQFLFYSNGLTSLSSEKIAKDFKENTFSIRNIHFIKCSQLNESMEKDILIFDTCKKIPFSKKDLSISQLGDGGAIFTISNDKICGKYNLNRYPYGITFSDLNIEKLSVQEFCTKYINKR